MKKYPEQEWSLIGENYDNLNWISNTPKPSKSELDNLWEEVQEMVIAEAEAKASQKAALLERLGITEEEAKLILR